LWIRIQILIRIYRIRKFGFPGSGTGPLASGLDLAPVPALEPLPDPAPDPDPDPPIIMQRAINFDSYHL
jgi:hypothetical protein